MKKSYFLVVLAFVLVLTQGFLLKPSPIPNKKLWNQLELGYAFIPSGLVVLEKDTISVQSFIMLKQEVSNFEYQLFLKDLRKRGELDKLKIAQMDSTRWGQYGKYFTKFGDKYQNHPAFRDYPVVNISYEGAKLYCEWLTEIWAKKSSESEKLIFRLPEQAEFVKAANGRSIHKEYTWGTNRLFNKNGQLLCNHLNLAGESIRRNIETGELEVINSTVLNEFNKFPGSTIVAPVKSYWKNDFGIYNLNGNVAEMIAQKGKSAGGAWNCPGYDVRNQSIMNYSEPQPMIGFRPVATCLTAK